MDKLKNCPFCGAKPTICACDGSGRYWTKDLTAEKSWGRKMTYCKMICFKYGCETKAYLTRRGLFNAWNRRVGEDGK